MPQAIVQATMWEPVTRVASGVFIAAFQQGLVTADAVSDQLRLVGRHSRVSLMGRLLVEVTDGAESLAGVEFMRLAERAGLPKPLRQSVRLDADGKRRYLDVDFGRFSVEVDGPLHWGRDVQADLSRQNALVRTGQRILRFSAETIRTDPDRVVRELRGAWQDLAESA